MSPAVRTALAGSAAAALLAYAGAVAAHEGGAPHQHDDQTPLPPAAGPAEPAGQPSGPPPADNPPADAAGAGDEPARPVFTPARTPREGEGEGEDDGRQRTIPDSDWRQRNRVSPESNWIEPTHFAVELRFAPYAWQVQDTEGLNPNFFSGYYGADPGSSFYFGLEFDWLPIHIPYVGSVGGAFGWGWANISEPLGTQSGEETETEASFTVFPMHASAVIRVDGLLRRFGVPVVPHAKVGFGFAPWTQSDDAEEVAGQVDYSGSGVSAGLHLGLGGSLALNAFDQSAARAMYQDTGIRYAYLWAEWMYDDLGGIGKATQLRVGTSTVALGLALDW